MTDTAEISQEAARAMLVALNASLALLEREFLHMAHSQTREGKVIARARSAISLAERGA
jgi:hypothetical protein